MPETLGKSSLACRDVGLSWAVWKVGGLLWPGVFSSEDAVNGVWGFLLVEWVGVVGSLEGRSCEVVGP